ncbi:hypothetical protein MRX96_002926 [Rhipicephalus microplus]
MLTDKLSGGLYFRKHSVPGYLSKIFKVMTERFVKLFVSSYKPSKRPYAREPESKPELKAAKYIDQPAEYMLKQVQMLQ